jgi:flavin-dependent dehydrogenase
MAGLIAAACLAEHVEEVVLVERRAPRPDASIAPQGGLPHVLLLAGLRVIEETFPGVGGELREAGADGGGPDPTRVPGRWVAAGRRRDHLVFAGNTYRPAMASRALLESRLRERVRALAPVTMVGDTATRLAVADDRRAAGVHLRERGLVEADLVVDASGRGAPLAGTGEVPAPPVSEVVVDVRYTGFVVERRAADFDSGCFAVVQNTRAIPRTGFALPHEGGAWQVMLGGYFGEQAPTDRAGAVAFARTLADPVLAEVVSRPDLAPPRRYRFRSSLRRHWERVPRPLQGYCPIGDAVASFNPVYGQGMSSAALQARALGDLVGRYGTDPGLAARVARATSRVVDSPWLVAAGSDFVYPRTRGPRRRGQGAINAYLERVMRAAAVDEHVNDAFTAVQNLVASPYSLLAPGVVSRSLRHAGRPSG